MVTNRNIPIETELSLKVIKHIILEKAKQLEIQDKNNPRIIICDDLFRETLGLYAFHEAQLFDIISKQMEVNESKHPNYHQEVQQNTSVDENKPEPEHLIRLSRAILWQIKNEKEPTTQNSSRRNATEHSVAYSAAAQ